MREGAAGRAVVISGGGTGIGRATAESFARAGNLAIAGAIVVLAAVSCSPYPPAPESYSKPSVPIWHPTPRTTWQWQLTTPVDQSVRAQVFDVDLFDNSAEVRSEEHTSELQSLR